MIVDAQRRYVLTANHVVTQDSSVQVTTKDGRRFVAKLIGRYRALTWPCSYLKGRRPSRQFRWATATAWRSEKS